MLLSDDTRKRLVAYLQRPYRRIRSLLTFTQHRVLLAGKELRLLKHQEPQPELRIHWSLGARVVVEPVLDFLQSN